MADSLSATFAALADPTRRAILARVSTGEASVGELAAPFDMSPASRFQASESAGARRADRPWTRGAMAALPTAGRSIEGRRRLDR